MIPRTTREVAETIGHAFESGDWKALTAGLAGDAVMFGTVGGIDEGLVMRGRDAVVEYLLDVTQTWGRLDVAVEAIYDAGDVAVVFLRETARSTHSDVPIESETATLARIRDGEVVELRGYMDREAALEAAGITP